MIHIVLSGFVAPLFIPTLFNIFKYYKTSAGMIVSLLPISLFIYLLSKIEPVVAGHAIRESYAWLPALDIQLSFYLDGLALTFALIITGIGSVVFLYASRYMEASESCPKFYIYLCIFMASMLGLVLADNLLSMFVFWELTSLSSFLLIGFNHRTAESRYCALQALLVTVAGGLAMLAGIILIHMITGTMALSELVNYTAEIQDHDFYVVILVLIFAGAFTKSAQVPFHFWLPNAMVAPTPVSAYLHSATMVKAGVYLLARLNPSLGGTELWQYALVTFGATTMATGVWLAIRQTDLKRLLAYTTLSMLGTFIMLIGIGTEVAIKAMLIYLLAHALYKGALFLVAGAVDHETGARDITKVSGLGGLMPITAAASFVAALSMMGIMPFFGFIGKEALYEAVISFDGMGGVLIIVTVLSNMLMVAVAGLTGLKPFLLKTAYPGKKPHDAPWEMWLGALLIALLGLILGLFPSDLIEPLVVVAAANILGHQDTTFYISLWHGFNKIFVLSLITVFIGMIFYLLWERIYSFLNKFTIPKQLYPSQWYDYALKGLMTIAKIQTRIVQNGNLRTYLWTILTTAILFTSHALFAFNDLTVITPGYHIKFYEAVVALLIFLATIMVLRSRSRLATVAGLGIVGFCVTIIFILYSAPDLAMTQFAVEVLTVILFILVLYKLPIFGSISSFGTRLGDLMLASAFGIMMMLIMLMVTANELPDEFRSFFAENAYAHAFGRNIVNVILVDFRALDTLGEIVVLVVAALGVVALLKLESATPGDKER